MIRFSFFRIKICIVPVFFILVLATLFLFFKVNPVQADSLLCDWKPVYGKHCVEFYRAWQGLNSTDPCVDSIFNKARADNGYCEHDSNFTHERYDGNTCVNKVWPGASCEGCATRDPVWPDMISYYCFPDTIPSCGYAAQAQQCNTEGTAWVSVANTCVDKAQCSIQPAPAPVCNAGPTITSVPGPTSLSLTANPSSSPQTNGVDVGFTATANGGTLAADRFIHFYEGGTLLAGCQGGQNPCGPHNITGTSQTRTITAKVENNAGTITYLTSSPVTMAWISPTRPPTDCNWSKLWTTQSNGAEKCCYDNGYYWSTTGSCPGDSSSNPVTLTCGSTSHNYMVPINSALNYTLSSTSSVKARATLNIQPNTGADHDLRTADSNWACPGTDSSFCGTVYGGDATEYCPSSSTFRTLTAGNHCFLAKRWASTTEAWFNAKLDCSVTIQGHFVDKDDHLVSRTLGTINPISRTITITGGELASLAEPLYELSPNFLWKSDSLSPSNTNFSVTASSLAGHTITSSPCINCTNHPVPYSAPAGNPATVNLPNSGNYADIYFKYTPMPCRVIASPSQTLTTGTTGTVNASVVSGLGDSLIQQMRFGSYNTSVATVTTPDSTSPYSTTVTPLSAGQTAIWATADLDDNRDGRHESWERTCETIDITDADFTVAAVSPTPTASCTLDNYYGGSYYSCTDATNSYAPQCNPSDTNHIYSFSCDTNSICVASPTTTCSSGTFCQAAGDHMECVAPAPASGWIQVKGSDLRWDKGALENKSLPSGQYTSVAAVSGGTSGVIFSGGTSGHAPCYGASCVGEASVAKWAVGKYPNPEVFTDNHSLIPTSYMFLQATAQGSGITPTTIDSQCAGGLNNCTLSSSLRHDIYIANGNLTLSNTIYTFPSAPSAACPASPEPCNYVILVNGDLTINANIAVPIGSTVIFSAKGNIYDNSTVTSIAGLYSADNNFYTKWPDNPPTCSGSPDSQLVVSGTVVANAGRQGGTLFNKRSLCALDATTPSIVFVERPDFMLNYPSMVSQTTRSWESVAP
jgi:hypothetical protein